MRVPKHQIIFDYISELIVAGKIELGAKLPTDGQLMARFSVSRGTVGKAMRDLENAGIVTRRAGDGTYAKHSPMKENAFLAVLIGGLGDTEFFEPICGRIAQSCHKHNLSLIWGTLSNGEIRNTNDAIDHFCHMLKERHVSGLFFVPDEVEQESTNDINQLLLDRVSGLGVRIVLLDRSNRPFPQSSEYDIVGIDNFHAGYVQTRHLLDLGCERIAFVARPAFLSTKQARFAGYRHAMKQSSFKVNESWIMEGEIDNPLFQEKIFKTEPDGIVCFHDPIAITLIRECVKRSIRIPQDIKIIGVDDVRYSQYLPVPLTTIRQPCQEIAEAAVTMMLDRLSNSQLPPRDLRLSTKLLIRQSTAVSPS